MYSDIILENKHFRLIVGSDCRAKSLLHKASGQECLDTDRKSALGNMDSDFLLVAKDDELGRTLQDLELPVRRRAPKKQ